MATLTIKKLGVSGNIGNSATLRVAKVTASGISTSTATLRLTQIQASGSVAPKSSTLRLCEISASGTTTTTAKLRITKLTSVPPLQIEPISTRTVEPFETVIVRAAPAAGTTTPADYVWRQISGPTLTLSGAGDTRSFVSPGLKDANTIVLGIKSQDATGNLSAEVTATVTTYPHTIFMSSGTNWVGIPVVPVPATITAPVADTLTIKKMSASGTAASKNPLIGQTVTDHGKTYTWDLVQDFATPAALGTVRNLYPTMGYFDTASQGFRDTSSQGYWAPDKTLSVSGGVLDINMHSETINGTSTPLVVCVMPDNYKSRTNGVLEIRYRTTANKKGYKFVGMFWPTNDVWNQGEIDWPEADLTETPRPANAVPGSFTSDPDGSNGRMQFVPPTAQYAATDSTDWHTARTVWNKDGLYFYWDGALVWSTTDPTAIPTKPMRIELQAETFIKEGTVPTDAIGHVLIDYVAAAS